MRPLTQYDRVRFSGFTRNHVIDGELATRKRHVAAKNVCACARAIVRARAREPAEAASVGLAGRGAGVGPAGRGAGGEHLSPCDSRRSDRPRPLALGRALIG